jgi:hypothetical protein
MTSNHASQILLRNSRLLKDPANVLQSSFKAHAFSEFVSSRSEIEIGEDSQAEDLMQSQQTPPLS